MLIAKIGENVVPVIVCAVCPCDDFGQLHIFVSRIFNPFPPPRANIAYSKG